jgi:hypothetical protein
LWNSIGAFEKGRNGKMKTGRRGRRMKEGMMEVIETVMKECKRERRNERRKE